MRGILVRIVHNLLPSPDVFDYVLRFSGAEICKGRPSLCSMTHGIWAGKNWKLGVTWRLKSGLWPLTHHICGGRCWGSAETCTGIVGWPSWTWPRHVVWASSQHGGLRIFRLLPWRLGMPQVSYLLKRFKLHCLFPHRLGTNCYIFSAFWKSYAGSDSRVRVLESTLQ